MIEVKLSQLGETMEEGTVVKYLVSVGDAVAKGDLLYELETDKATMEVESPADGLVKAFIAQEGQSISVDDTVLILGAEGEKIAKKFISSLKSKITAGNNQTGNNLESDIQTSASDILESVGGIVSKADIKLGSVIPLNRLQKITGQRMLQSKREIPCFYLKANADVTELVEFREKLNKSGNVKVSYNDLIIRAVAIALEKFPIMTGQLDGEAIKIAEHINIGLAISVEGGLVVAVIKDADKKNVTEIARDSAALIDKAKNNKLGLTDLEGACISISNLGRFGVESFIPIVIPGQCSILGIGQIVETCAPDGEETVIRKLMSISISVDHKVANGAEASEFLDLIRKTLEDPLNFQ